MPIGAAIGGAALAAGGTVAAGALGANAQKKAAAKASDTSLEVARENNDLFRQNKAENLAIASPFYNNGLLAGNALTDLLLGTHTYNPAIVANPTVPGGGTFSQFPASGSAPAQGALSSYGGPSFNDILALKGNGVKGDMGSAINQWISYYAAHPDENPGITQQQIGALAGDGVKGDQEQVQSIYDRYSAAPHAPPPPPTPPPPAGGTTTPPATGTGTGTTTPVPSALSAWDQFRNGTNYQWRLGQGEGALNSKYAASGMFDSGAADKAIVQFGQNFASNELSNYMNLLAQQQSAGLTAAGAVMGVSTNTANNIAAQNTSAANAAANAALASGNANASMWGSIGQGVGQIGGALFQYGTGQMNGGGGGGSGGYNVTSGTNNYFQAHPFG